MDKLKFNKATNFLNHKSNIKKLKKYVSTILLVLLTTWTVNATQNDFKKDIKKITSDTYPSFINVYGIWNKTWYTFDWFWLKIHTDNCEITAEKSSNFTKWSVIWLTDIPKSYFYVKWWISYLWSQDHLPYIISLSQTSIWGAVWYTLNKKLNFEGWYIAHKIDWIEEKKTIAHTCYLEWIYRKKTNIWQIDVAWIWEQKIVYWQNKNLYNLSFWYYPTDDIKFKITQNSLNHYTKDEYRLMVWIKYTFGLKKWKMLPYAIASYNASNDKEIEASYEKDISHRSLQWKDKFEENINISEVVAKQIVPKVFEDKIKEKFNKVKSINISVNKPSVYVWESFTLIANENPKNLDIVDIIWYDYNWIQIWTWNKINLTKNSVWRYLYYAIIKDNEGSEKQSNIISVEVKN